MSEKFTYPGSDLDRGKTLVAALGSFWSRIYSSRDQINSYAVSSASLAAQTFQNILETVQALSRFEIPVFHKEMWTPITLKKSEVTTRRVANNFFDGSTNKFDDTPDLFNGLTATNLFYFTAPAKIAALPSIFNRIIFPTVALTENVDYVIDRRNNTIAFADNPFDSDGFLRRASETDGVTDEEIVLWGFNGAFDYDYVFNQFAYALGIRLSSSQGYKDLTNAIINGLVSGGATVADLDLAFSAICGIPLTLEPEETVEIVDYDNNGLFISTDKHAYRFNDTAEPVVAVGQKVRAGSQLVRGFEIDEFFVGSTYGPPDFEDRICCPPPNINLSTNTFNDLLTENSTELILNPNQRACLQRKPLTALALDSGFIAACFYGDLVFENKEVPLYIDKNHPSGYTFVSFQVAGMPADVEYFFDEIHFRGVTGANKVRPPCPEGAGRYTLAQLLDKRKNRFTEPDENNLPKTINPLRFLVENVLRNNVFVVKISVAALGKNRLGLYNIRHLRQLLPPGTAMILVFDLAAPKDVILGHRRIEENLKLFTGMNPATDTIDENLITDLGVTVRLFSGTCQ